MEKYWDEYKRLNLCIVGGEFQSREDFIKFRDDFFPNFKGDMDEEVEVLRIVILLKKVIRQKWLILGPGTLARIWIEQLGELTSIMYRIQDKKKRNLNFYNIKVFLHSIQRIQDPKKGGKND